MPRRFFPQMIGLAVWWAFLTQSPSSSATTTTTTYRRHVAADKRQHFLERTLILLDVNTRSPVRLLNDNFLSLQVDPSILKNGWLDFLRYPIFDSFLHSHYTAERLDPIALTHLFSFSVKKKKISNADIYAPKSYRLITGRITILCEHFYFTSANNKLSNFTFRLILRMWKQSILSSLVHNCCGSTFGFSTRRDSPVGYQHVIYQLQYFITLPAAVFTRSELIKQYWSFHRRTLWPLIFSLLSQLMLANRPGWGWDWTWPWPLERVSKDSRWTNFRIDETFLF